MLNSAIKIILFGSILILYIRSYKSYLIGLEENFEICQLEDTFSKSLNKFALHTTIALFNENRLSDWEASEGVDDQTN